MVCHGSDTPFGPTMGGDAMRSNPLHDIHMMFPEGHSRRKDVFDTWSSMFGKEYASASEKLQRMAIFHTNLRFINGGNRRGLSYVMSANHFADYTQEELSQFKGRLRSHSVYCFIVDVINLVFYC